MEDKKSIITEKDVLILKQLLEDGRKSSASISKEIDLGREIVNYRIKRLIKENLIVKFVPKINEKAFNYQEYIILLKLNLDDELSKEQFIREHIGNKYLIWTIKSESGWDLIVRLYASSMIEFKEKLAEILENFSSVLASYYTIISSEEIKENEKEIISKNLFNDPIETKDFEIIKTQEREIPQLDDKDKEIIKLLEEDARIQYKEIAENLNISSDTVKYRIDKMRNQGIIENFTPVINLTRLGFYQYAAIAKFNYLNKDEEEKIRKYVEANVNINKTIKSLSSEEYFMTLIFDNKEEIEDFVQEFKIEFAKTLVNIDYFTIE